MIVLVTGGRDNLNREQVFKVLDTVCGWSPTGHVKIVCGGQRGVDQLATEWAKEKGEDHIEYPIAHSVAERAAMGNNCLFDFDTHGRGAGPMRNAHMVAVEKPDQGVVFQGGNGTHDMLTRLWNAGVNTWVVGENI